ncbi:OadG family protein [Desulfopila sp. IMCC35008]|uniref:OadG family protein n=1 Tax=Desulfopila sp. IMCC35008 TaxID=2653858 RepID=UPI0013D3B9E9|nr:OadG family protein [Desulfopila sp. IMCC35008]
MDTVELLAKFSDPEVIGTLSLTQRLLAGLITTILGMGITFLALVILQIVTSLFEKLAPTHTAALQPSPAPAPAPAQEPDQKQQEEELIAAITVALATQLQTTTSKIVIRNIRKLEDHSPTWNRVGLAEQMNNNS